VLKKLQEQKKKEKLNQMNKQTRNEIRDKAWSNRIQFQQLHEPLNKTSNFSLFSDHIILEVSSQGLGFVLNKRRAIPRKN